MKKHDIDMLCASLAKSGNGPPDHDPPGQAEDDVVGDGIAVVTTRNGESFVGRLMVRGETVVVMAEREWTVIGIDEIVYIAVPPPKITPHDD